MTPFHLGDAEQRDLAKSLSLPSLSPSIADGIATAIANYKATQAGSPGTTIANTLAALAELKKKERLPYEKALARLADDYCAVDDVTLNVLQPLARATLRGESGAKEALAAAANARADKLGAHKRVDPRTEALRVFCGWLRIIFMSATDHLKGCITEEEAWRRCRFFAQEVFTVAGINHHDFSMHPKRLTEYLRTEVP